VKLANIASTRLTDEEYAFLRQLADQEERRPADILRRLVIAAKKQRTPADRRQDGALVVSTVS